MFSLKEVSKHVDPIDKPQPKAKWEKKNYFIRKKRTVNVTHTIENKYQ